MVDLMLGAQSANHHQDHFNFLLVGEENACEQ